MPRTNNGWYALRYDVLKRDNFTCQYCGQFAPNVILQVDHKIEVALGGTDDIDNLITSCIACNQGKEALRMRTSPREATLAGRILKELGESGPLTVLELVDILSANRQSVQARMTILRRQGKVIKMGSVKWGAMLEGGEFCTYEETGDARG